MKTPRPCKKCGTIFDTRHCKTCVSVRSIKWQKEHPEKKKAAIDKWRAAHPENGKKCRAKYYASHKEESRIQHVAWRIKNPEKVKVTQKKYRDSDNGKKVSKKGIEKWRAENPKLAREIKEKWNTEHPEALRIHWQNRRARERNADGMLSKGLTEKLFKLQKGKCPCCKLPLGGDFHLDHKMPLALGGTNADSNMQLLRKRCNLSKQDKHPVDFMQSRGFLL